MADVEMGLQKEEKKGKHRGFGEIFQELRQNLLPATEDGIVPNALTAGEKPIITGLLLKREKKRILGGEWKKRWVALYPRALIIYRRQGDSRPKETVLLTPEFYVTALSDAHAAGAATLPRTGGPGDLDDDDDSGSVDTSDDVGARVGKKELQFAFLVSDLECKLQFAAKNEEEQTMWVHTLTSTLRKMISDDDYYDTPQMLNQPNRSPEKIQKDYEDRLQKYVLSQRKATMAKAGRRSMFKKAKEIDWEAEEKKWASDGERIAQMELAQKLLEEEREHVRRLEEEQKAREREVEEWKEKAGAAEQRAAEAIEKEKKLESELALMQQIRQQNKEKEEALIAEHDTTSAQLAGLQKMRRQSQHPTQAKMYEDQIKVLEAKLAALQDALNVDLDGLDWDGSLEDAELKLKELMPKMMSENEKESMEAQTLFEQYDKIIRNHADYIKREEEKTRKWEEEQKPKNEKAYNEMIKIVPKEVVTGLSEEFLRNRGLTPGAAKRIMNTKILQFLYLDKEKIARTHIADLNSRFVPNNLDIRELRAIYTRLPEEFTQDNGGHKKTWLENYRVKLKALVAKEESGKLTRAEEKHPAYRSPEENKQAAAAKAKAAGVGGAKKKGKKGAAKPKALKKLDTSKLEGLFGGGGAGGPKKGGPPKLPGAGGPPPHVLAMMNKGKENDGAAPVASPSRPPPAVANKKDTREKPKSEKRKSKVASMRATGAGFFDSVRNLLGGGTGEVSDPAPEPKPEEPKPAKTGPREMTEKEKLLAADVRGMMDSVKQDYDLEEDFDEKNAPAFDWGADYGTGRTRKKTMRGATLQRQKQADFSNAVEQGIQKLCNIIKRVGKYDRAEGGVATITFGELHDTMNDPELVGLLMRAKKRKRVKYSGDLLFYGIHSSIVSICLLLVDVLLVHDL